MGRERGFLVGPAAEYDWRGPARDLELPLELARELFDRVLYLTHDPRQVEILYLRNLRSAAVDRVRPRLPVPGRKTLADPVEDPRSPTRWLGSVAPGRVTRGELATGDGAPADLVGEHERRVVLGGVPVSGKAAALAAARARGMAEMLDALAKRSDTSTCEVRRQALAALPLETAVAAWSLAQPLTRWIIGRWHSSAPGVGGAALAAAADRRGATIFRRELGDEINIEATEVDEALRKLGAGQSLAPEVLRDMEARLRAPLAHVRVHTDAVAAGAARAIHARAFTVGEDVFFARGEFNPASADGRALLLHELTHVVQYDEGRVPAGAARRISHPSEPMEHEARDVASRGGRAPVESRSPRAVGAAQTGTLLLRDPPPPDRADRPDPADEAVLRTLLTGAGITPPRLSSVLSADDARRITDLVAAARATPSAYGPRMVALYVLREVQASGGATLVRIAQRLHQFQRIMIVRPDGYIANALSGQAIQRAGALSAGSNGLRAGGYEVGRFYFSDGGVFYETDANLGRTGPAIGELGLEGGLGPIDAMLDGVEDALRTTIQGLVHLIRHPIQSIRDLANLPGVIRALIANAPEYWERFRAMPLNDQIREISRITTTVALTYGSAAGVTTQIARAAGQLGNLTVNVLRITQGGQLAVATVAVPVGQVATALAGAPGGLYVLHMANNAAGEGGGGGGGDEPPRFTEENVRTLISDTNPDFPLSRGNAEAALTGPPGTRVRVAGPGGAGADVEFLDAAGQAVLRREIKSISGGVNSFNTNVSHAATQLAGQGEIWVQVASGTDVQAWLRAFVGRRDAAALARYSGIELRALDPAGGVIYQGPIVP